MPLRLSLSDYLNEYSNSIQAQDPLYQHTVSRITREVAEAARTAYSHASGGSRTSYLITGVEITVKSEREEAENAPVDLKPGLLSGRSSKISKKGIRYAVVPFRKRTPGRGRGGLYTLPHDVYRVSRMGGTIKPGTEMGERFRRIGYGGEEWTTGPFAGLTKYAGGGAGSSYFTFRTVTENSPPLSWIRPPFLARQEVVQGVEDFLSDVIPNIINDYLGPPEYATELEGY